MVDANVIYGWTEASAGGPASGSTISQANTAQPSILNQLNVSLGQASPSDRFRRNIGSKKSTEGVSIDSVSVSPETKYRLKAGGPDGSTAPSMRIMMQQR